MTESLKKQTINGLMWNTIRNFSQKGISFFIGIILARLLSPNDYGMLAMIGVFTAIVCIFTDGGLTDALIRKQNRTEKDLATVFYYNFVVTCLVYFLLFISAPWIADFYDMPELIPLVRWSNIVLIIGSFGVIQGALLTIKIDFKTHAQIAIVSCVISGIVGVSAAYMGCGVWSLVVQNIVGTVIGIGGGIWCVRWYPKTHFSMRSFKELFGFSSRLLASRLLVVLYDNMQTVVIGKFFSATQLGLFNRAQSTAAFPSSNLTSILSGVSFPVLSKIQDDDIKLAVNYRKMLRFSAFIVFPLMVGLAATAESFVKLVLTEKWMLAVPYMQVVCFAMMWYPIHSINMNLLQIKGRSDLFLRVEIIKKIIGVIILCVTVPFGVLAMCYGMLVMSLLSLFINTYYTGKLISVGFKEQLYDLWPIFLNCLFMGGLAYTVQSLFTNVALSFFLSVVLGGLYYVASSYFMKLREVNELLQILKNKY